MSVETADWLLTGKEEIRSYLKNASDYKLNKWIAAGMPINKDGGEWTAHKGNLEEWFRKNYTRCRAIPEQS